VANKYTGSNEGQETVEAPSLAIDDGTLHVDAANNRVGIGTKTPSANLEIEQSSTGGSSALKIDNDDTDQIALEIEAANIDADVISISASALTTGNALFIDHNDTATTAVSPISLHLDFDKSGVTADTVTSSYKGIDFDMNDAATNHSGSTVNMTGIDMDIVSANATGTLTNIGLDVVVSGADKNIPIRIEGGGLQMKETATPAATADYGQIYTKTDNLLYFQDGAGTEQKVTEEILCISCSDETTNLTTGNAKVTFHMPFAMTLTTVKATVTTAPVGSTIIVDIEEAGATILTTLLTIDASEKTSSSAATAAVIGGAGPALADDALMIINIDQIGSSTAGTGLKVWLYGYRA
jgi:hypothetical protein